MNNDIILKEGENVINNATEVCTLMNEYYVNITQCIGIDDYISESDSFNDIIDTHSNNESVLYIKKNIRTQNVSAPRFVFKQVSSDQVLDKIRQLNSKKSAGCDNFPPNSAATKWGYLGIDLNWRYHI